MPSVEIQKIIPKIRKYMSSQPIQRAYLFGSCSRGEETPESDIDLLVNYDYSQKVSLMKVCTMMSELETILHRPVDLVEEQGLLPFAQPSANHDKILIYERAH